MNRQQRRMAQKKGLPVAHEPVFNMKQSDIKKIKQEASEKAVNTAMILLLGIPVKVLKEQYGWGMKKRLPEFCEAMIDVYTDFSYVRPEDLLCTEDMIFPLQKAAFEDVQVSLLNGVDKYLTSQFGNYMELPPENQRKTHNPKFIDFGDGNIYKREG